MIYNKMFDIGKFRMHLIVDPRAWFLSFSVGGIFGDFAQASLKLSLGPVSFTIARFFNNEMI